ncbi:hypothetical protein QFZ84_001173 [Pseudomonas fluorescens]
MVLVVLKLMRLALRFTDAPDDRWVNATEQVEH